MSTMKGLVHPHAGPIVPVIVRQGPLADELTAFEAHGYAILDTGAALTGIDEDLAIRLKLPPAGTIQLTRPGPVPDFTAGRFRGQIGFPGTRFPPLNRKLIGYSGLDTWFEHPGFPDVRVVALIGRDVLEAWTLNVLGGRREVLVQRTP